MSQSTHISGVLPWTANAAQEITMRIRSLFLSLIMVLALTLPTAAIGASAETCEETDGSDTGTMFGVNTDWAETPVPEWSDRLGMTPAAFTAYVPFPVTDAGGAELQRFIDDVVAVGGMAILRVEPTIALTEIGESDIAALAEHMARINGQGVSVLLVFAPEMNGSWNPWGQQPVAYVEAFRQVADAVHTSAPDTAMVWSPNYGGGYPFGDARSESRIDEFSALDTNGDTQLTSADDPYAPYYPGDAWVDWSGLTLFHWGGAFPWGRTRSRSRASWSIRCAETMSGPMATRAICRTSMAPMWKRLPSRSSS